MKRLASRSRKNLITYENPYPWSQGDKATWDYTGPYEVICRKYHWKDGKKQWIVSVTVWDGTYKKY